jgi:hypothetical protein
VTTSSSRQIAQCASIAQLKQRVETAVANVDRSALLLSLRHALSDQQVLRWLLRPLKELAARHSGGGGKSSSSASASASLPTLAASSDDSVVKVLLSVPCLQREVMDMLIEQVPALQFGSGSAGGAGGGGGGSGGGGGGAADDGAEAVAVNFPRLILSQFCWVDFPMDFEHLAGKLHEVLDACEADVQRDVVALLPEVVPEAAKSVVVDKLLGMMTDNQVRGSRSAGVFIVCVFVCVCV